jgi:chemotaxis protein methyltransferase CheR
MSLFFALSLRLARFPMTASITDKEFARLRQFIYDEAGISLSQAKKSLVCGRLAKRLTHLKDTSYTQYLQRLTDCKGDDEAQTAINLLTTNETFFFREAKHFDLLQSLAASARGGEPMRVWSAACSTGDEPYSMAMVLADTLGVAPWDVLGTDISTKVLACASRGHYPNERARHVPPAFLKRYCLKGVREVEGSFLVERSLRERVSFARINLNEALPDVGQFDCIFLRNVMIYFDKNTRRGVVARVLGRLKRGGVLCVGHSESLNGISNDVMQVMPSVYRKA